MIIIKNKYKIKLEKMEAVWREKEMNQIRRGEEGVVEEAEEVEEVVQKVKEEEKVKQQQIKLKLN